MNIYEEYTFYREYCVDEDAGEIPLNFEEWKREYYDGEIKMRKLNKKQKGLIDTFIQGNKSGGMFLPCSVIDPSGIIENNNWYESCWSDIERYYADNKGGK